MGEAYVANAERKAVRKIVGFDNLRLILRILLFVGGGVNHFHGGINIDCCLI